MPGNSSGYRNTSKAMNGGAFGAPITNPSQSYTQASNAALNNSGLSNNNNWAVNAGKGWTNNNGTYSNANGNQYNYDPSKGWQSAQGFMGSANPSIPKPSAEYKFNNPDSFGPGIGGNQWDKYGIDKGDWQRGLRDAGLSKEAYKMQQGYNPSTIYSANQYAQQFGQPAYNADGRALTGTGLYSGAADGVNNNHMKFAMGLDVPRDIQRAMGEGDPTRPWAQNAMSKWAPNAQGGWERAPDVMDPRKINEQAYKGTLTAYGYTKPDQAGFGSALGSGYGQPVLDTSGATQNPFTGGFTTTGGNINQGILTPPTRQQLQQMYRPGGANYISGGA